MWSKYEALCKRSQILDNLGQISRKAPHPDSATGQRLDWVFLTDSHTSKPFAHVADSEFSLKSGSVGRYDKSLSLLLDENIA